MINYSEALDGLENFIKNSEKMIAKKELLISAQMLINTVKDYKAGKIIRDVRYSEAELATILVKTHEMLNGVITVQYYLKLADNAHGFPLFVPVILTMLGALMAFIGATLLYTTILLLIPPAAPAIITAEIGAIGALTSIIGAGLLILFYHKGTRHGMSQAMNTLACNKQREDYPTQVDDELLLNNDSNFTSGHHFFSHHCDDEHHHDHCDLDHDSFSMEYD